MAYSFSSSVSFRSSWIITDEDFSYIWYLRAGVFGLQAKGKFVFASLIYEQDSAILAIWFYSFVA